MLDIVFQTLSYLAALGIPYLMLEGGQKPHFYYPLYAIPILSLSYFSGPLSTAGMFLFAMLIGIAGFIFSVGDFKTGVPFLWILQMGFHWALFVQAGRMIERKDHEIHRLEERIEKFEIEVAEHHQNKKTLERNCQGLKERIVRYSQLRSFMDQLAGLLHQQELKIAIEDSVPKLFDVPTEFPKDVRVELNWIQSSPNSSSSNPIHTWLEKNKIPLLVSDFAQDQRFFQNHFGKKGSLIAAPILRENEAIASLELGSPHPRFFEEEDLRFLYDISGLVSLALSSALYYEQVETLAVRDTLTGLYVRYRFDEKIEEEFYRSQRSQSPLSLILFDIDHFKNVNDRWGHGMGDEVLRSISALILGQTRETDFCARYGGEEIVVLMPWTTLENATLIAERIRSRIASQTMGFEQISVTISGGVSTLRKEMKEAQDLLQAADQALYRAKEAGRNKILST